MAVEFEDVHDIKALITHKPEKMSVLQQALVKLGVADDGRGANKTLFFMAMMFFVLSIVIFIVGITLSP